MEQSQSWETDSHPASEEILVAFMEPKGSLLWSQSATGPHLEPEESSPLTHIQLANLEKSTNYEVPHCAVFFILLLLPLCYYITLHSLDP
jgi:hypothetical protein